MKKSIIYKRLKDIDRKSILPLIRSDWWMVNFGFWIVCHCKVFPIITNPFLVRGEDFSPEAISFFMRLPRLTLGEARNDEFIDCHAFAHNRGLVVTPLLIFSGRIV